MTKRISIASQYTRSPAGRFRTDGPFSGERFREELLWPALSESTEEVEVDLQGVLGFGSSFLEEAFGGIVRHGLLTRTDLKRRLRIRSDVATYERRIWKYVDDAKPER